MDEAVHGNKLGGSGVWVSGLGSCSRLIRLLNLQGTGVHVHLISPARGPRSTTGLANCRYIMPAGLRVGPCTLRHLEGVGIEGDVGLTMAYVGRESAACRWLLQCSGSRNVVSILSASLRLCRSRNEPLSGLEEPVDGCLESLG